VLRDPAGSPRGMVRVTLRWKYPFQSPETPSRQREGAEKERMAPSAEVSQRPIAKPRVSVCKNNNSCPGVRFPKVSLAKYGHKF